jgi:hypothetical protein
MHCLTRDKSIANMSAVTDVAGEMNTLADALPKDCQPCQKACIAAVTMLAVGYRTFSIWLGKF